MIVKKHRSKGLLLKTVNL